MAMVARLPSPLPLAYLTTMYAVAISLLPTSNLVPRYMSPVVLARRLSDKSDAAADGPPPAPKSPTSEVSAVAEGLELDEDSDSPSDLEGAIRQSSQASALFVSTGGKECELLSPAVRILKLYCTGPICRN